MVCQVPLNVSGSPRPARKVRESHCSRDIGAHSVHARHAQDPDRGIGGAAEGSERTRQRPLHEGRQGLSAASQRHVLPSRHALVRHCAGKSGSDSCSRNGAVEARGERFGSHEIRDRTSRHHHEALLQGGASGRGCRLRVPLRVAHAEGQSGPPDVGRQAREFGPSARHHYRASFP